MDQNSDYCVRPYAETRPEETGPGVTRRVLAYAEDVMAVENSFETGARGALHSHPHSQLTYIVSGRFRFTIGDKTFDVSPGDTLIKRNGVLHGCVCLEKGVLVDFFTPMREDFIKGEAEP